MNTTAMKAAMPAMLTTKVRVASCVGFVCFAHGRAPQFAGVSVAM